MRRFLTTSLICLFCVVLFGGCDVPTPPPELPTATPGSQNPENPSSRLALTPIIPTPEKVFAPLNVGPGYIYFVRDSGLWRVAPDSTGEKKLSELPLTNAPQPSPDGKLIAFTSGKDLYVVPSEDDMVGAHGRAPLRALVSGGLADNQRLGWSPDGSLVGYLVYDLTAPGLADAWAVPAKGGHPQLIASGIQAATNRGPTFENTVQWSPDGQWVVAAGANNRSRLLRWPVTGSADDVREIAGGEPDWSPDSATIVYAETLNGALSIYYVIESGATPFRNEQQSVGTGMGEYAQGPGPRWSPASSGIDSDPIAYRSHSTSGEPRVSIRRLGGLELAPLPSLTNNPSWSPSGDCLVVETGRMADDPLGLKWVPDGLAISKLNFSGEHTLTPLVKDARWPAWGK